VNGLRERGVEVVLAPAPEKNEAEKN
jgi:hypothetical protein